MAWTDEGSCDDSTPTSVQAYEPNAHYEYGDVVTNQGKQWRCKAVWPETFRCSQAGYAPGEPYNGVALYEDIWEETIVPTASPTAHKPSHMPSLTPSTFPSTAPSNVSSTSHKPSLSPSESPSNVPSSSPSEPPSNVPSAAPSTNPSVSPSAVPSDVPSSSPSVAVFPSAAPSDFPSDSPSNGPSSSLPLPCEDGEDPSNPCSYTHLYNGGCVNSFLNTLTYEYCNFDHTVQECANRCASLPTCKGFYMPNGSDITASASCLVMTQDGCESANDYNTAWNFYLIDSSCTPIDSTTCAPNDSCYIKGN